MNPIIELLAEVIQLYMFCVIAWAILATLISFRIVNKSQEFVVVVMRTLDRLVNPALKYIRRILPDINGIDLSPIVLLLLLGFTRRCLYYYFYTL